MNISLSSEKQSLLSLIKKEITSVEYIIHETKKECSFYYEKSDISNKDNTFMYFQALNGYRNELRKLKIRRARLAVISKNLKEELRK